MKRSVKIRRLIGYAFLFGFFGAVGFQTASLLFGMAIKLIKIL